MQAARSLILRQWGERTLRGPLWESLVASSAQARSVQSSAGNSGVERKDGPAEADEWLADRRGFASAAAPEDGAKSQKGYWRDLVKERLDEELEAGAEAKDVAEGAAAGAERSRSIEDADARPSDGVSSSDAPLPITQSPPEQSLHEPSTPPEQPELPRATDAARLFEETLPEQPGATAPKPAPKVFKPKLRQDIPPKRTRTVTDPESATAWMERLLEKQRELTLQRQAVEGALRGGVLRPESAGGEVGTAVEAGTVEKAADQGAPELKPVEKEQLDLGAPVLKPVEREQLDIAKGFAHVEGLGAADVKALEPEVGLPQLSKNGDRRLADAAKILEGVTGAQSRSEAPKPKSDEQEQLDLAKGFAKVEGLSAEKVTGLEREVGLPPLEQPPKTSTSRGVERTGESAPPEVQKSDDDPLGGSRKRSEEERLSAAAKILAAIGSAEGEAVLREVESGRRKEEPPRMAEPREALDVAPSASRASEVAERARAAAEVFEQIQQAVPEEKATVAPRKMKRIREPVLKEEPRPSTPPVLDITPGPAVAETLPQVEEVSGGQVVASEGVSEEWSVEEQIAREMDAISRVPEELRESLAVAADLQKISLGWDEQNEGTGDIDVAYVYPNALAAAEELEWAARALQELIHSEEPPPLALPTPPEVEEEEEEEEEEDWFLSPYERERRRRATAPVPQHEREEEEEEVIPPKNFRFVSQRAHPLNIGFLDNFIDEQGSIIPRRITGLRKKDQNKVERAIKTARQMGLLPILSDLDWRHPTIMRLFPPVPPEFRDENEDGEEEFDDEEFDDGSEEEEDWTDEDFEALAEVEEIADQLETAEWQDTLTLESVVPEPESEEYDELGPVVTSIDVGPDVYEIRDITGTEFVSTEELGEWENAVGEEELGEGEETGNGEQVGEGEESGNGEQLGEGEKVGEGEELDEGEKIGGEEGKAGEAGQSNDNTETLKTEAPDTSR